MAAGIAHVAISVLGICRPAAHGPLSAVSGLRRCSAMLSTTASDVEVGVPELLKTDRYIASNRFAVRPGSEAKFEARWANRKSRLASLDGFKYFTLMRRVPMDGIVESYDDDLTYVSLTIWETKANFDDWRKGDAFKEAHGGTSIGAFLGAMISSLRVLKGPPKPVFYDGVLHLSSVPDALPPTSGGWRLVEADGSSLLPAEAFIACNRFT